MMSFETGELHPNSPHLFADLAELLLLVGYLGRPSLHTNDLESLLTNGAINSDEIDDEADADAGLITSAERNSRHDQQIEDVMSQLKYRAGAFSIYYPFSVVGESVHLNPVLTEPQRIYRLLLCCSRLRSFAGKGIPQRWAKIFTELSKIAMAGLSPLAAVTKIFDANSSDRTNHYGTDLRKALRILGRNLGVLHINEAECDASSPSGDKGLDLVSYLDFQDGAAINYAILGQCAAQEIDWPKKTLESQFLGFSDVFSRQFDYPSVMFTPICYRDSNGAWVSNSKTNGVLIVDRLRITHLLTTQSAVPTVVSEAWFEQFETEFLQLATMATAIT